MVKKKREIACEIETAGEPSFGGDIKLGPTAVLKALHVPNRPPKRFGVGCFPVSDAAEILDRQDDPPRQNITEEADAGLVVNERIGRRFFKKPIVVYVFANYGNVIVSHSKPVFHDRLIILKVIDKEWTKLPRFSQEYISMVLIFFLDFTFNKGRPQGDEILCSCATCRNHLWAKRYVIYDHLIAKSFLKGYYDVWVNHGEKIPSRMKMNVIMEDQKDSHEDHSSTTSITFGRLTSCQ
ncbi:hypothetical protein JHK87_006382 [Glycine soja]|nr:hypothetical protein JHK87_006382 [Glycine soja]